MFPVANLSNIPDPRLDSNWNWTQSDLYFENLLQNGIAPFLKLGVMQWVSGKLTGLSYQNFDGNDPVYVVPRRPYPPAYGCNQVRNCSTRICEEYTHV